MTEALWLRNQKVVEMNILVFKTDIGTKKKVRLLSSVLDKHPIISNWSVDTTDVDNVLRVEARGEISETDIIELIKPRGFRCEELPD